MGRELRRRPMVLSQLRAVHLARAPATSTCVYARRLATRWAPDLWPVSILELRRLFLEIMTAPQPLGHRYLTWNSACSRAGCLFAGLPLTSCCRSWSPPSSVRCSSSLGGASWPSVLAPSGLRFFIGGSSALRAYLTSFSVMAPLLTSSKS